MLEGMRMGEAQWRHLADAQQWAHGKPGVERPWSWMQAALTLAPPRWG